jgi:nucleoside-diphosphate-sugar epimerase
MEKIAVTGGAGFLGSHIVRGLLSRGREVSVIDDFSSGSARNLRDLATHQECMVGDLRNREFARNALRGVETVFHFAAEVGSVAYLHGSQANELAAMQSNLMIDASVFRACIENRVRNIIYASSVSVYPVDEQYGSHAEFREEDSDRKINPEGGYGWSKYIAEKQLRIMPDISFGVARIFHAYGKNIYLAADKSQVIGSLIRKAINFPKEDFVIWGDGSQKRSFVFVDDVLDALFRLQDYVEMHGSLTVNVGSKEETTVRELARMVIHLSKKDISPRFDLTKPKGALCRMPNLERIGKELGWSPRTSLPQGLAVTYEWASERLAAGIQTNDIRPRVAVGSKSI